MWKRVTGWLGPKYDELDRRSPVDPRIVFVLLVGVIVAAVVTSGFGLLSDDSEPVAKGGGGKPDKVEVAVLNATIQEGVADPVAGIADLVADDVVDSSEFKAGVTANAPAGEAQSVIMFEPDSEADAEALAEQVRPDLGETAIDADDGNRQGGGEGSAPGASGRFRRPRDRRRGRRARAVGGPRGNRPASVR